MISALRKGFNTLFYLLVVSGHPLALGLSSSVQNFLEVKRRKEIDISYKKEPNSTRAPHFYTLGLSILD